MADELEDPTADEESHTPLPVEENHHQRGDDRRDTDEMSEVVERVIVIGAIAIDPALDAAGSIGRTVLLWLRRIRHL